MPPMKLANLDLDKTYTYADYLKWDCRACRADKGESL